MVAPISSLSNMEMQLYGGRNFGTSAPSYMNGYQGSQNMMNQYSMPMFNGYNNYQNYSNYQNNNNSAFGQSVPMNYGTLTQQVGKTAQAQQGSVAQALTKAEADAFINYYAKGLTPTETLFAAGAGQAVFAITEHPRLIAHWWNSGKTIGGVEKMFKGIKNPSSELGKLWADPKSRDLIREAYMQTHKAQARLESKLGLFRSSYSRKVDGVAINKEAIENLIKEMKDAVAKGNKEKIAEVTAKMQQAYVSDGAIKRGWNGVKNFVTNGDNKVKTVKEALADTAAIDAKKAELLADSPTNFKSCAKKAQGGLFGPLIFFGMEFIMGWSKISAAFAKDKENEARGESTNLGWKQLGQTTVKAAGNAAGWTLGEAAGMYAFSKWGGKIGQKLGAGAGSALGRIIPLVGAGIAMCLTGKLSRALVGRDIGDKIEAENLAKTEDGQKTMLQYAMEQAQAGKQLPPEVQNAATKIYAQYT